MTGAYSGTLVRLYLQGFLAAWMEEPDIVNRLWTWSNSFYFKKHGECKCLKFSILKHMELKSWPLWLPSCLSFIIYKMLKLTI